MPQVASSRRRAISAAQTSAVARWNCCAVSSRSVYRISTVTPARPSSGPSGVSTTACRRRIANAYAARPRYASVLPPPVGKNSSCAVARSPDRFAAAGSVSSGSCMRMNASWNVNHECGLALPAARTACPGLVDGLIRVAARGAGRPGDCTRWSAITSFMNRKQRSASASVEQVLEPVGELLVHLPRLARPRPGPRRAGGRGAACAPPPRRRATPRTARRSAPARRAAPSAIAVASLRMSSSASISSAVTCGVSQTGSQVVHTLVARRAPSASCQSTEQVRPTANSSRSRYCRFSRRTSSSCSCRGVEQRVADRQERVGPVRRDGQLGLVQPGVDRDLPRRSPGRCTARSRSAGSRARGRRTGRRAARPCP